MQWVVEHTDIVLKTGKRPWKTRGCNMLYVQTALLAPHAQHAATLSKRGGGHGLAEARPYAQSVCICRRPLLREGLARWLTLTLTSNPMAQVADAFREHLKADEGAEYDQMIEIDLNELQPQARPGPCSLQPSTCMPATLSL
jgi:hypothetical protein